MNVGGIITASSHARRFLLRFSIVVRLAKTNCSELHVIPKVKRPKNPELVDS